MIRVLNKINYKAITPMFALDIKLQSVVPIFHINLFCCNAKINYTKA